MVNRHDDTPEINDYTYYVFEEIEKRGLQFALPPQWRPIYNLFLKERKRKREVAAAFQNIAAAFRTDSARYSDDFGNKDSASREENPKANNSTGLLEE